MMKQVVQDVRKGETSVIEVPVPQVMPGTALIRTVASLVSVGTERALVEFAGKTLLGKARSRPDLVRQVIEKARREGLLTTFDAVQNRLDQPLPLGYSSAGVIEAVGEGLSGFQVGDRIACAGGGYAVHAEYAVVPQNLIAKLPMGVDFESGAFATLGAIALHGFRLGEPQLGDRVAVIGLGLLGLLAAKIAQAAGCAVFGIDTDPERVKLAEELGLEAVHRDVAETEGPAFTGGAGFDLIQICADTPSDDTVQLAGVLARDRAIVVATGAVGTQLPRRPYYMKELRFVISRSYGPGRYDPLYEEAGVDYPRGYVRWTEGRNLDAFLELLGEGKFEIQRLITHRFPIERAIEAYDLISASKGESSLGVLLTYPHEQAEVVSKQRKLEFREPAIEAQDGVRLGAIGAGNFATSTLFPAMKDVDGLEWIGLATATGMKAEQVGKRFGFAYATTDVEELLEDQRINTIAILTRHHLHASQAVAALEADKHVFCEKPLALTREELEQIETALHTKDKLLSVGFNRRFAPLAIKMKNFLDGAREPLVMHYRVNAGPLPLDHWLHDPATGGGRMIGEACHFIDFLTFLTNSLPVRVFTMGLPDGGRYREDNFVITLEFADGSVGSVSYLANGDRALSKERIEVFGGGRAAVLDDFRRLELTLSGRTKTHRSQLRQDKGHRAEWRAFQRAITQGSSPPIPYKQIIAVSLASFAAHESLRSGEPYIVGLIAEQ
jgi:predicted dehydrogenase/threonine dehydrogenase-like Zn-dependent dehydrogenase